MCVRYNADIRTNVLYTVRERVWVIGMRQCSSLNYQITEINRSERRIQRNRALRQRELRRNVIRTIATICLIIIGVLSVNNLPSKAQDEETAIAYKYYTSITVPKHATLWSIAEEYMDREYYETTADYICEVKAINSLSDDRISYGEHLVIPYYASGFIE